MPRHPEITADLRRISINERSRSVPDLQFLCCSGNCFLVWKLLGELVVANPLALIEIKAVVEVSKGQRCHSLI